MGPGQTADWNANLGRTPGARISALPILRTKAPIARSTSR